MKQELEQFGILKMQVSLKDYNTFRLGGICDYMIEPKNVENLKKLLFYLQSKDIKYFILGNGSNVILADAPYHGVVIRLCHFNKISFNKNRVDVEAGVMLPKLVMKSVDSGLSGLEWAAGIPGTLGASIYGNAGAYGSAMFDFIESVTVLTPSFEVQTLLKKEIDYGYRTSFFKENKGYIILSSTLILESGEYEASMEKIRTRKEKRLATQPLEYPSAGSIFRNPKDDVFSGKLIEDAGLKGKRLGGAMVSEKHANFIVNTGNATSEEVRNLIELIHQEILDRYDIDLVMEQEYVGWD